MLSEFQKFSKLKKTFNEKLTQWIFELGGERAAFFWVRGTVRKVKVTVFW